MKSEIYKCEQCNRWAENAYEERWIEMKAFNGDATISRANVNVVTIKHNEPKHFCSVRCLIEYIAENFSKVQNEVEITDKILELLETDNNIEIGDMKVSRISEFKASIDAKIPSDIWQEQVKELGLNPDDYLISNKEDGAIINVYKAHYESKL